jgi:hypothetical protein
LRFLNHASTAAAVVLPFYCLHISSSLIGYMLFECKNMPFSFFIPRTYETLDIVVE